jgi:gamma-glutamyltranspeptidase/glutathione hydrolase
VTFSYGEGNGIIIGDSGIMMNNLMGEEDLFPDGFHRWPAGQRLATMMSPSIIEHSDGSVSVLGSGGANRIRSALLQVIRYLLDHDYSLERAVEAARLHFESGTLNAETFEMEDGGASLAALGAEHLVCFERPNLFFGGVHAVRRHADGTLEGAGDPRRGGVCLLA